MAQFRKVAHYRKFRKITLREQFVAWKMGVLMLIRYDSWR
jgi:hypothetical protein